MRPTYPSNVDVVRAWIEKYLEDVHTAFPGRVESYDAATQTADIQPLIKHAVPQPDGTTVYEDLPQLLGIPVLFPRTEKWFVAFAIAEGDTVLVQCCESAIGHWRDGDGSEQYPGDLRRHSIAHAVAIPGMFVHSKALGNAPSGGDDSPALVIGNDEADGVRVTLKNGGALEISQGSNVRFEIQQDGTVVHRGGSKPVAKEGSGLNVGKLSGQAGPYPVVFTYTPGGGHLPSGGTPAGQMIDLGGVIESGQGSQNVKVP